MLTVRDIVTAWRNGRTVQRWNENTERWEDISAITREASQGLDAALHGVRVKPEVPEPAVPNRTSPEYLRQLADRADPEELWRLPIHEQLQLEPERRMELDTGVALRRHAQDLEDLQALVGTGRSLVYTPLGMNGRKVATIQEVK